MPALVESPHGELRFDGSLRWLLEQPAAQPLLVLAPTLEAGSDLLRAATRQKGAVFGWAMESLSSLATRLSALPLAARGLVLSPPLGLEAVCVRVVAELAAKNQLGRLTPIADRPGLPGALLRTFSELGLAAVEPETLPGELGELYRHYRATLASLQLADRATVFQTALEVAREGRWPALGVPLCAYDVSPKTALERALLGALIARAPRSFVTRSSTDGAPSSLAALVDPSDGEAATAEATHAHGSSPALRRLQQQLFSTREELGETDPSVSILSAPGESRESVEIARRILVEAERGVPFDRMAIVLRSPFHYRTHLLEALRRAKIPAYFTREASRPEPGGRALLVLLECAAEGISATRFAEYLSLGVVPERVDAASQSPPQLALDEESARLLAEHASREQPVRARSTKNLSLPRRWESLLVNAAVIGGAARWHRRLADLERRLEAQRLAQSELSLLATERELESLRELSAFALPIVDLLGALPQSAAWGEWLDALNELALRAIDAPEPILSVLAQLEIVRSVGPVGLKDVLGVLRDRLGELSVPSAAAPAGCVWVASVEEARGRVFDVVFVPGLAEKLFPQRVVEDPLLSDEQRELISPELETQLGRIASERSALALAVGAAKERVVLSYPRFESDKARPRVPSFYALEAIRAAEGRLPGFAELARRADEASQTRMGWPAPRHAADAIDVAEYDLAQLQRLLKGSKKDSDGAAHYLLRASSALRRALQFRARRWHPKWHYVDGLVEPNSLAREALSARHRQLLERGFAVTGLEKYAACPYRFYLSTIAGLRPRREATAIEEMNPATRGLLIHELLRTAGEKLNQGGFFSDETSFSDAKRELMRSVNDEAAKWRDKLAPAIPRVWDDAIADIGADLAHWLQLTRESGWHPVAFEHAFGAGDLRTSDKKAPVLLECGLPLHGMIDAVERAGSQLRATDYKTGAPPESGSEIVVGGGRHLQPTLYALVLEQLYPDQEVTGGNAFFCTSKGQFLRSEVPLGERARQAAHAVHGTIQAAFELGFFPAAPAEKACDNCDFRRICGPYERERVARKDPTRLEPLVQLRAMP